MKCRRELEKEKAKEAYFQKTLEGKTVRYFKWDDDLMMLAGGKGHS